jgi:NAD dependent epimerase/dehydratase family enzyme
MKTTLGQQIVAIQKARRRLSIQLQMVVTNDSNKARQSKAFKELCKEDSALNDAGSTIAGVNFIGENKINLIDSLIHEVGILLEATKDTKQLNVSLCRAHTFRILKQMKNGRSIQRVGKSRNGEVD